ALMTTVSPASIWNTRIIPPPLTVMPLLAPSMVRLLLMSRGPLPALSVMVMPARLPAKTILSPLLAAARISPRRDPSPLTPLSELFMTVSVLSRQRLSNTSSRGRMRETGLTARAGRQRRQKPMGTLLWVKGVAHTHERKTFGQAVAPKLLPRASRKP